MAKDKSRRTRPQRARTGNDKQLQLIRAAEKQGWQAEQTNGGHIKLSKPGHKPLFTSSTPSDGRAWLNFRSQMRRAGIDV